MRLEHRNRADKAITVPYSDADMEVISRDPIRLRAWWWHMAQHHRRLARQNRDQSRATGRLHPVTNYKPHFEEGRDLERWAGTFDAVASAIDEHIDLYVRTTLDPARCTCRS